MPRFRLGVNVDHVATLRQARGGATPDPVAAAKLCEKVGADSIVMHLREDRRHIQDRDLFLAKRALKIKLNLEMSVSPGIVRVASRLRPGQVTLVPEKRQERTTEGGLDLFTAGRRLDSCLRQMRRRKIPVSLFIDPDEKQIRRAAELGVRAIELHTGDFANARGAAQRQELARIRRAAALAGELGLVAHAGHGLDYENVKLFRSIRGLDELNIGYSIICRAVWTGLGAAVRDMKALLR